MIEKHTINVEVLVVGGDPAKFAAAYTAEKNGVDVLVAELSGDLGVVSATGLMSHWKGRHDAIHTRAGVCIGGNKSG